MNIYVESNFILEITFEQEQNTSCELILQLCEAREAKLIVPAYSLAEPHEKLNRQARNRRKLKQLLDAELRQLSRTASYGERLKNIEDITSLIVQSNEEEQKRFIQCRQRVLKIGEVIALNANILTEAVSYELALSPQDALVYASVISHLRHHQPRQACFLNRNSKDFQNPDIIDELRQFNCRMIPQFSHGYDFLRSRVLS